MNSKTGPNIENFRDIVLENLSTAILVVNQAYKILFANQSAESLLEESASQLSGRRLVRLLVNGEELSHLLYEASRTSKSFTRRRMSLTLLGKHDFTADVTVTPLIDAKPVSYTHLTLPTKRIV